MTSRDGVAACADQRATAPDTGKSKISLEPASAYEAVTRQMVLSLSEELKEIKARLNGLLFMVAGSVLLEVALRLANGR